MVESSDGFETRTFHWSDARREIGALVETVRLELEPKGRWFQAADEPDSLRLHPPLVFPLAPSCPSVAAYLAGLGEAPGRQLVVLMQAGAVSLGWFDGGEEVQTKSFKRYVVRGSGHAQQTHLSSKGKSRYGSRLRLRNAQRLLEDTNERLAAWWSQFGAAEQLFVNTPSRLWASLFEVTPAPPFERAFPTIRIPRDLPKPSQDVLRRAYRSLCYGRIETGR